MIPDPQLDMFEESERIIHNGQILHEIPGVHTTPHPGLVPPEKVRRSLPEQIQDVEPDKLAGLMAAVISAALDESPTVTPMEIVNRLLRLNTERGHKVVWTRFDVNQLFALWTNKLEQQRTSR